MRPWFDHRIATENTIRIGLGIDQASRLFESLYKVKRPNPFKRFRIAEPGFQSFRQDDLSTHLFSLPNGVEQRLRFLFGAARENDVKDDYPCPQFSGLKNNLRRILIFNCDRGKTFELLPVDIQMDDMRIDCRRNPRGCAPLEQLSEPAQFK